MKFDLFTMCTTLRHNSHTYGPAVFKLGGSVIHKKHYILRKVKRRLHIAIGMQTGLQTRLQNTVYVFGHAHLHVYDAVSAACRWKRSTRSNIYIYSYTFS